MSDSSAGTTVHSFPPNFPLDDDYISAALAEWNFQHKTALKFDQLDADAQGEVTRRAQRLKEGDHE